MSPTESPITQVSKNRPAYQTPQPSNDTIETFSDVEDPLPPLLKFDLRGTRMDLERDTLVR